MVLSQAVPVDTLATAEAALIAVKPAATAKKPKKSFNKIVAKHGKRNRTTTARFVPVHIRLADRTTTKTKLYTKTKKVPAPMKGLVLKEGDDTPLKCGDAICVDWNGPLNVEVKECLPKQGWFMVEDVADDKGSLHKVKLEAKTKSDNNVLRWKRL